MHRRWRARRRPDRRPGILVVGSLRAGGSGKTDWVDWIASRHSGLALLVHPTGDEDRLLESRHPGRVFRDKDLLRAWTRAERSGFRAAVSDGGLQDPALDACPAILLGETSAGWADLHPFGPFRQRRASRPVELELREDRDFEWERELPLEPGATALVACSVAKTEIVIEDVRRMGHAVAGALRTRDHGRFDRAGIARLERRHGSLPWVLTEKDVARGEVASFDRPVHVLRRRLRVPEHIATAVDELVARL